MAYPNLVMFDVDETLIDHEKSARLALEAVINNIEEFSGICYSELREIWARDFQKYWKDVIFGKTTIEENRINRFESTLKELGSSEPEATALKAAEIYGHVYDSSISAIPGSHDFIMMIRELEIPVALITNNLVENQKMKLEKSGFSNMYDFMITSEETGLFKPDGEMFNKALERFGVSPEQALMIGNSFAEDVVGAFNAGVKAAWFNRSRFKPLQSDVEYLEIHDFQPVEITLNTVISWF